MNKLQHTPTPWQVHESSPSSPLQIIGNIDYNADGSQIDYDVIADMGGLDADDANAAFIVRAVNSHEALVEAATWAIAVISNPDAQETVNKLRAALKLAREG